MLVTSTSRSTYLDDADQLNSHEPRHWTIICGVGAGGAAYLRQAVKKAIEDDIACSVGFILLDARPVSEQGRGIAWASNQRPFALTNMRIGSVGYDPADPNKLVELLGVQGKIFSLDGEFMSRAEVGEAFSRDLNTHIRLAEKRGIRVDRIQGEAAAIDPLGNGHSITLNSGDRLFAHTVVLALGHLPPDSYKELTGLPGYLGNPWDLDAIKSTPASAIVAILGLGPTAVDTINILREQGVKNIHALSRSGRVQYPRPHYSRYEPEALTAERIKSLATEHGHLTVRDVVSLIHLEYKAARVDCAELKTAFEKSRLSAEQAIAHGLATCGENSNWFSVLKALDTVTPLIWHHLPPEERALYMRKYRQDHVNVSYGSASKPAKKILEALHDGSLSIHGNFEREVRYSDGKFHLSWLQEDARVHGQFDCVINCSGVGTDLTKARYPLFGYLLTKGWLTPHPDGGGLVDFESGQLLFPSGKPIGSIYSLVGSITYGTHLLTHCMDQVVNSAKRTSDVVHKRLLETLAPHKL
ncbi:FAD/NAD(P)-binding protein [Bradyrhizobium sp. 153]|uniref:FAD/NAD(P)-binding protein n=1 Tax=Bradyrhizobium sp. 153 TaxID=2782627 RepID=UPI001FF759F2|nr:FAD/NAD(P)-binding protein [Bradyrhizobium sp. 153]MCK1665231.1 FAD/NAD(P)-binding protein [Bradyrhizobium sp. 153]